MNDETGYNLTTISMVNEPLYAAVTISPSTVSHQEIRITNNNNETLVAVDFETGVVEFGDNYNIDEATEIFWTSMGMDSPERLKNEIQRMENEIAKLQERLDEQEGLASRSISILPTNNELDSMIEDIEYFRSKLINAMATGRPFDKIQKQLAILEEINETYIGPKPKQAEVGDIVFANSKNPKVYDGSQWIPMEENLSEIIANVQPMQEYDGQLFKMKKRSSHHKAFEKAMEILD